MLTSTKTDAYYNVFNKITYAYYNVFSIFILAYYPNQRYHQDMILKRKIYDKLKEWKELNGTKALLIEGARRVGKSTIAEEFAKNEYKSYILINFSQTSSTVKKAFEEYLSDLDKLFTVLSFEFNTQLYERQSIIIFDEVQQFPRAREAIKFLVQDGRFDYLETGSLLSIRENVERIIIPSEERSVKMHPLDFEEFCWALGEIKIVEYIKNCYMKKIPLLPEIHKKAMEIFREYIVIGGMPQSIIAYTGNRIKNIMAAEQEKKDILQLYRNDIMKIKKPYREKVATIFNQIPSILSRHEKRVILNRLEERSSFIDYESSFFWLDNSMICNNCFNTTDPNIGLALNEDRTLVKCYMGDTGLLISHTFSDSNTIDINLIKSLIAGKLSINEGMFFENVIAQMLVSRGYHLFFYTHYNKETKHNDMEIDFIISKGSKIKTKIFPIEVKSGEKYAITSLTRFKEKYSKRIGGCYVIHTKNYSEKDGITYLPCYMTFLL